MASLTNWITGQLSGNQLLWYTLAPGLAILSIFLIALLCYAIRVMIKGPYHDAEVESRGSTLLAGMFFRLSFAWMMQPIYRILQKLGIPPNAITTLSLLLAFASGFSVAAGKFSLGGWLYIFAGICDFFDGRIARNTGQASPSGAALDSIVDRYSDSAILVGLAWYYQGSWVMLAVLIALVGSHVTPYVRARGESLGISVHVGSVQRVERIAYLGIAVALSPIIEAIVAPADPHPSFRLAIAGIVLLAISTQLTSFQRTVYLLSRLSGGSGRLTLPEKRDNLWRIAGVLSLATVADFLLVILLVTKGGMDPWLATAFGGALGAMVYVSSHRIWTNGNSRRLSPYLTRYAFVSCTSVLLNAGGVGVMMIHPIMDYRVAWLLVRVAVLTAWNIPLHRNYVLLPPHDESGQTPGNEPSEPPRDRQAIT